MRLTTVTIENFRGIRRAEIELDRDVTVLVGENNSGKTSILEGLRFCLDLVKSDKACTFIFQWNGADPRRLEALKSDHRLQVIQLPENYRCPAEVVVIANRLIAHNAGRPGTKRDGVSHKVEQGHVVLDSFADFEQEIEGLVKRIERIAKNRRESCLVIARSNKLLAQVRRTMQATGINAEIVRKQQDFASPLAQLVYHALKLANAPDSRSILNKLCAAATLVNGITLSAEEVMAKAEVEGVTSLQAFFSLAEVSEALRAFAESGRRLLCDSMSYREFAEETFRLFDALNHSGGADDAYPDYVDDKENWRRISDQIRHTHGEPVRLHLFLQEMDLSPKAKPLAKDCVRLQTVHTAKGAEFENVFVIGLVEDQFPIYFAIKNGETAIQEERRNCFVAITRSSKNLYLSYARNYFGWNKEPSRFLIEMGLLDNERTGETT
jgi:DNA helicase-2/ATP-dependent DNA helicase PcrA